jgi:hypothetical protein
MVATSTSPGSKAASSDGEDLLADALAPDQDLALLQQPVVLDPGPAALGVHGLGPRLDDVELAIAPVLRPLDVHGLRVAGALGVVLLDLEGPARQLEHLLVLEHQAGAVLSPHAHLAHRAGTALVVDQLHGLLAELPAQHRSEALPQRSLVDPELVGIDTSLDDRLPEPPGARHQDDLAEAGLGVEGEDHTGSPGVAAHHLLHAHRERDVPVGEAALGAVDDGAVGEERGHAAADGGQQGLVAVDVQVGVLLARERRGREVLGGRAGTDRHVRGLLAVLGGELRVGAADVAHDLLGERRGADPLTDAMSGLRQGSHVPDIQAGEGLVHLVPEASLGELQAESRRGDREPVGDPDPTGRQVLDHLAERGVLTPHLLEHAEIETLEGNGVHVGHGRRASSTGRGCWGASLPMVQGWCTPPEPPRLSRGRQQGSAGALSLGRHRVHQSDPLQGVSPQTAAKRPRRRVGAGTKAAPR